MKRFGCILMLLAFAVPAWPAAKKVTAQDLKDMMTTMQQAKKSDEDVALQLKQVDVTEELTPSAMNGLLAISAGKLTTEQLYILEARSAVLPPPPAYLPPTPAPDAATQKAMLDKAADYVGKNYEQLPHLTASRVSARFQDGVEAMQTSTSSRAGLGTNTDPLWEQTSLYTRLMGVHSDTVESENGIEKVSTAKDKTQWGQNGQIVSVSPGPVLNTVMQEATAAGTISWLRWEAVNGHVFAVFSFTVDKKKTHYAVNYCCFPDTDTAGEVRFSPHAGGGGAAPASTSPTAKGTMQTVSSWKPFKASTQGYHGEFFIDPTTGTVIRMVVQADFKTSDFVHHEDTRVDYAPLPVGGKTMVVPVREFVIAEVVPNGDSFAARVSLRHNLYTADYKDYQIAGSATTAQK